MGDEGHVRLREAPQDLLGRLQLVADQRQELLLQLDLQILLLRQEVSVLGLRQL